MIRRVPNLLSWALFIVAATASASVIAVPRSAFPATSISVDFSSLPSGTDLNDIVVDGVSFSYTVDGIPERDAVQIGGGPGITNNLLSSPSAISQGDNAGIVKVDLAQQTTFFGYGYALLSFDEISEATTISIFTGTTFIGSLGYSAFPDPQFAGGFAGIESTVAFNHVEFNFNSDAVPAFAFNGVMAATLTQVPEPGTTFLACLATVSFLVLARLRAA